MKKAIIVGASSGIGQELARVMVRDEYLVAIVGRRLELLNAIREEYPDRIISRVIDISQLPESMHELEKLIEEMQGVDVIVISAGVGFINRDLEWQAEKQTIDVNVLGFTAVCNVALKQFYKQGSGHLVGISSIAALLGNSDAPAYNASKAFVSNYLQGIRAKVKKDRQNITITEIKPGFVDTAMAQGEVLFWVAKVPKAAEQIYQAIKRKKKHAYITRRWRLIGWILRLKP